jgi:hypothetical protein
MPSKKNKALIDVVGLMPLQKVREIVAKFEQKLGTEAHSDLDRAVEVSTQEPQQLTEDLSQCNLQKAEL